MTKSAALFICFCSLIATPRYTSAAPVSIQLAASQDGLTSLVYEGGEYLSRPYVNAPKGSFHVATKFAGNTSITDNTPVSVALNGNTLTNRYGWGIASCTYTAGNDQITFTYTIKNTSDRTLDVTKLTCWILRSLPSRFRRAGAPAMSPAFSTINNRRF